MIGIALCYADFCVLGLTLSLFRSRSKIKRSNEVVNNFDFPRLGGLVFIRYIRSMIQPQEHDYYYGSEAEQYTFYRFPKALFSNDRYKAMSDSAKILYGLMLDRMGLSLKNGWLDKENRVFIYFTLEDLQEYMNCGHNKGR